MNFNVITYLIYLPLTSLITIGVGLALYKNGKPFILNQLKNNLEMANFINKMLFIGYCLINLGYCFWIVKEWEVIHSWTEMISSLSRTLGFILLGLGLMHFFNLGVLSFLGTNIRNQIKINHK